MSRNGLPYLPLYADDWLNDDAVMLMSAEAEGCYIRLLCSSWKSKTPGVVPVELVPVMCGLTRVQPEDRERVLAEVARAFYVTQTEWTQKRMQTEYRRLAAILEAKKRGGSQSRSRQQHPKSPPSHLEVTSRTPAEEVDLEVDLERDRKEVGSTPCAEKSEPAAMQPFKSTSRPKPDPTAREPATCHHCRHHFARPAGSTRQTCPDCHRKGIR